MKHLLLTLTATAIIAACSPLSESRWALCERELPDYPRNGEAFIDCLNRGLVSSEADPVVPDVTTEPEEPEKPKEDGPEGYYDNEG